MIDLRGKRVFYERKTAGIVNYDSERHSLCSFEFTELDEELFYLGIQILVHYLPHGLLLGDVFHASIQEPLYGCYFSFLV